MMITTKRLILFLLLLASKFSLEAQVIIHPEGQSIGNNAVQKQLLIQQTEDSAHTEIKSVAAGYHSEADAILKLTTSQNSQSSSVQLRKYGPLSYDILDNVNLYGYGAFWADKNTSGLKIGALKTGSDLEFFTSSKSRMFVDSVGKFGFNTNLPQAKYHFYHNTPGEILRIQGIWPTITIFDQTTQKGYLNANPNDFQIGSMGEMPLKLRTGTSDRITILPNGKIGVNTTNPLYGFDFRTNVNVAGELYLYHNVGKAGAVATSSGPGFAPYWRNLTAVYAKCKSQIISGSSFPVTYHPINFNIEEIDENDEFSVSSFTPAQSGIYKIEITLFETSLNEYINDVDITAWLNSNSTPAFYAWKRNSIIGRLYSDPHAGLFGTSKQYNFTVSEMIKLNAGDTLTFKISCSSDYTFDSKIMIYAIH